MLLIFYLAEYLHLIIAAVHWMIFFLGGWFVLSWFWFLNPIWFLPSSLFSFIL